ncbi:MAG: restriction endonuclease subunit S [Bacteroidetes bacterium]|nr:restriction endonuclease subunit S [Bacteroidota bacterium]
MKKIYILNQLCDFRFGTSTSVSSVGDVACVQGRDFNEDGIYINKEIQFVKESALKYAHYLNAGDILFSTKGKIFSTVWQGQVSNVIATGTFIILSVKVDFVLPEYLSLFLNSKKAKRYFDVHTKAGTVTHIGKKDVELLEVEIPPIEMQRTLIKTHQLLLEEKILVYEIISKKEKMLNDFL